MGRTWGTRERGLSGLGQDRNGCSRPGPRHLYGRRYYRPHTHGTLRDYRRYRICSRFSCGRTRKRFYQWPHPYCGWWLDSRWSLGIIAPAASLKLVLLSPVISVNSSIAEVSSCYAAALTSATTLFLPITPMASGMVVRPPIKARAKPAAFF